MSRTARRRASPSRQARMCCRSSTPTEPRCSGPRRATAGSRRSYGWQISRRRWNDLLTPLRELRIWPGESRSPGVRFAGLPLRPRLLPFAPNLVEAVGAEHEFVAQPPQDWRFVAELFVVERAGNVI